MARDISQLHPRLQAAIVELKKQFPEIGIGECFRTVDEQNALYAKGRTAPGNIVTNAKGTSYQSQHQWGIAFDFFKNIRGQEYIDIALFEKVGAFAKSLGLGWGGDWTNPVDRPHLYLPDWGSTTSKLKNQYGTPEAFIATWIVGGWQQDATGWWWKEADGSYPSSAWKQINGHWYYFDERGYMVTGWKQIGGTWYYMEESGAMATGWVQLNGKWYFMNNSGAMVTGLQTIGSETFYFAADGHMCVTNERGALI